MTLALDYRTDYEGFGNAYGYAVHNAETKRALAAAGVRFDAASPVAFHVASGQVFRPVPGKMNVLYTAWETGELPKEDAQRMAGADVFLVTAPFLKSIFETAFPGKSVHVVPLGVDVGAFPYRARRIDRRHPFRYLWVGAPNTRKGFGALLETWRFFENDPGVELYLKTTATDQVEQYGNVIFDARNLSRSELVELYHSAHAFVFPTYGEGFGLTLFEALATGCPTAWTDCTAPGDYLKPGGCYGYPLPFTQIDTPFGPAAQPDPAALVRTMIRMREEYAHGIPQRKARRAARLVRERFSWSRTAREIIRILSTL